MGVGGGGFKLQEFMFLRRLKQERVLKPRWPPPLGSLGRLSRGTPNEMWAPPMQGTTGPLWAAPRTSRAAPGPLLGSWALGPLLAAPGLYGGALGGLLGFFWALLSRPWRPKAAIQE